MRARFIIILDFKKNAIVSFKKFDYIFIFFDFALVRILRT